MILSSICDLISGGARHWPTWRGFHGGSATLSHPVHLFFHVLCLSPPTSTGRFSRWARRGRGWKRWGVLHLKSRSHRSDIPYGSSPRERGRGGVPNGWVKRGLRK